MSELTKTQLNALVLTYGQAAARTARAPRNSSAARYAFEDTACTSLLAAIGALVKERDELRGEKDCRTCLFNSRDFCLSSAQCVGGNMHVASEPVRRWVKS